jgi:(p)ppGpp synthase/HD superfamily hydrolase
MQNNLYHLPRSSTAYDFACHAMPDDYKLISGVRINGREHPIDTPLHDGDTVEVLIGREAMTKAQRKTTDKLVREAVKKEKNRVRPPRRKHPKEAAR